MGNQDLNPSKKVKTSDKRNFFRIFKDVVFDFKCVDVDVVERDKPEDIFDNKAHLNLLNKFKHIDREHNNALKLLTDKNRLLGDYLGSLNQKLDLIAQHILFSDNEHSEAEASAADTSGEIKKNRIRVNLSEDGVSFISPRALYKGSFIAIRLVFLPSYTVVSSFAKILRCDARDKRYQAAAQFYRLGATEQQEISREIMKTQMQQKRMGE